MKDFGGVLIVEDFGGVVIVEDFGGVLIVGDFGGVLIVEDFGGAVIVHFSAGFLIVLSTAVVNKSFSICPRFFIFKESLLLPSPFCEAIFENYNLSKVIK